MNALLPVHNALVHVPMGVALTLPLVAAVALLGTWRTPERRLGAAVLAALQAALLAGCLVSLRSGEAAEDGAEDRGASHGAIEEHEERAEVFAIAAGVALAAAVGAVLAAGSRFARPALLAAAVLTLPVAGIAAWTGDEGGDVAHPDEPAFVPPDEGD